MDGPTAVQPYEAFRRQGLRYIEPFKTFANLLWDSSVPSYIGAGAEAVKNSDGLTRREHGAAAPHGSGTLFHAMNGGEYRVAYSDYPDFIKGCAASLAAGIPMYLVEAFSAPFFRLTLDLDLDWMEQPTDVQLLEMARRVHADVVAMFPHAPLTTLACCVLSGKPKPYQGRIKHGLHMHYSVPVTLREAESICAALATQRAERSSPLDPWSKVIDTVIYDPKKGVRLPGNSKAHPSQPPVAGVVCRCGTVHATYVDKRTKEEKPCSAHDGRAYSPLAILRSDGSRDLADEAARYSVDAAPDDSASIPPILTAMGWEAVLTDCRMHVDAAYDRSAEMKPAVTLVTRAPPSRTKHKASVTTPASAITSEATDRASSCSDYEVISSRDLPHVVRELLGKLGVELQVSFDFHDDGSEVRVSRWNGKPRLSIFCTPSAGCNCVAGHAPHGTNRQVVNFLITKDGGFVRAKCLDPDCNTWTKTLVTSEKVDTAICDLVSRISPQAAAVETDERQQKASSSHSPERKRRKTDGTIVGSFAATGSALVCHRKTLEGASSGCTELVSASVDMLAYRLTKPVGTGAQLVTVNSRYLDPDDLLRVLASAPSVNGLPSTTLMIRSGMDTGKTTSLTRMLHSLQEPLRAQLRVLYVCCRRSLTSQAFVKLASGNFEVEIYDKALLPPDCTIAPQEHLGVSIRPHIHLVQVESLWRFADHNYDIVVIDEAKVVLQQFESRETHGTRQASNYAQFEEKVKAATTVLALDAGMDDHVVGALALGLRKPTATQHVKLLINQHRPSEDERITVRVIKCLVSADTEAPSTIWIHKVLECKSRGLKVVAPSVHKVAVDALIAAIQDEAIRADYNLPDVDASRPWFRTYTSETSIEQRQTDFGNVDLVWDDDGLQLVSFSPTITVGVDCQARNFDVCVGFVARGGPDPRSAVQMLRRVRRLKLKQIIIIDGCGATNGGQFMTPREAEREVMRRQQIAAERMPRAAFHAGSSSFPVKNAAFILAEADEALLYWRRMFYHLLVDASFRVVLEGVDAELLTNLEHLGEVAHASRKSRDLPLFGSIRVVNAEEADEIKHIRRYNPTSLTEQDVHALEVFHAFAPLDTAAAPAKTLAGAWDGLLHVHGHHRDLCHVRFLQEPQLPCIIRDAGRSHAYNLPMRSKLQLAVTPVLTALGMHGPLEERSWTHEQLCKKDDVLGTSVLERLRDIRGDTLAQLGHRPSRAAWTRDMTDEKQAKLAADFLQTVFGYVGTNVRRTVEGRKTVKQKKSQRRYTLAIVPHAALVSCLQYMRPPDITDEIAAELMSAVLSGPDLVINVKVPCGQLARHAAGVAGSMGLSGEAFAIRGPCSLLWALKRMGSLPLERRRYPTAAHCFMLHSTLHQAINQSSGTLSAAAQLLLRLEDDCARRATVCGGCTACSHCLDPLMRKFCDLLITWDEAIAMPTATKSPQWPTWWPKDYPFEGLRPRDRVRRSRELLRELPAPAQNVRFAAILDTVRDMRGLEPSHSTRPYAGHDDQASDTASAASPRGLFTRIACGLETMSALASAEAPLVHGPLDDWIAGAEV